MDAEPLSPAATAAPGARRRRDAREWSNALLWTIHLCAATIVTAIFFLAQTPDAQWAERVSMRELRSRLDSGETVERAVYARQRHPSDYFRATHGIFAATDRRSLFVGVKPELDPAGDVPALFEVHSLPYESTLAVQPGFALFGRPSGVAVRSRGGGVEQFATSRRLRADLEAVARIVERHRAAYREWVRREAHYRDSITALPPIRELYTVQRGDALEVIAKRTSTTTAALRTLNGLGSDRIRAGQLLVLRITPHVAGACPVAQCGPTPPAVRP